MMYTIRILFFVFITTHLYGVPPLVQEKLDILFTQSNFRVLRDKKSLTKAKFKIFYHGRKNNPYIAKHPLIPGYIFKIYTDSQDVPDARRFWHRVNGSEIIREAIIRNGYEEIFKVPNKWIYEVPPGTISGHKTVLLVAEEMDILSKEKNERKWKSKDLTRMHAEAIYVMFSELGLSDTVYAFNLPFCKDGKMAFIDTEIYYSWPVDYDKLTRWYSLSMQIYWKYLIGDIVSP